MPWNLSKWQWNILGYVDILYETKNPEGGVQVYTFHYDSECLLAESKHRWIEDIVDKQSDVEGWYLRHQDHVHSLHAKLCSGRRQIQNNAQKHSQSNNNIDNHNQLDFKKAKLSKVLLHSDCWLICTILEAIQGLQWKWFKTRDKRIFGIII